jgi:hypothetical protein
MVIRNVDQTMRDPPDAGFTSSVGASSSAELVDLCFRLCNHSPRPLAHLDENVRARIGQRFTGPDSDASAWREWRPGLIVECVVMPGESSGNGVAVTRWLWRGAAGLSASVAVAAVPIAVVARLPWSWPSDPMGGLGAFVLIVIAAAALLVTVPVACAVASECGIRRPWVTAVLLVAIQAAVIVILSLAAPFRPGLLSVLLYWAPAMVLAAAVLRATHAALLTAFGLMVAVVAVAVPVRLLQQAISAEEWLRVNGIPSRAYAQVITVPGSAQDQFQWDSQTGTLTADFVYPGWTSPGWGGTEMVTKAGNPCRVVLTAPVWAGYAGSGPASCAASGPGQWELTSQGLTGYALRTRDVTIVVTTGGGPGLAGALLAHHQASNAELWSLTSPFPRSILEWITQ